MHASTEQRRERRDRYLAERLDLALSKSRQDGTYMLVDRRTGCVVAALWPLGHGYGLSLDDVIDELYERTRTEGEE